MNEKSKPSFVCPNLSLCLDKNCPYIHNIKDCLDSYKKQIMLFVKEK